MISPACTVLTSLLSNRPTCSLSPPINQSASTLPALPALPALVLSYHGHSEAGHQGHQPSTQLLLPCPSLSTVQSESSVFQSYWRGYRFHVCSKKSTHLCLIALTLHLFLYSLYHIISFSYPHILILSQPSPSSKHVSLFSLLYSKQGLDSSAYSVDLTLPLLTHLLDHPHNAPITPTAPCHDLISLPPLYPRLLTHSHHLSWLARR